jgi:hypothetical protein
MATIYKYIEKGLKGVEGILGAFSKMTGGGLGNALGAAILGAPLLLGGIRLITGGLRGLIAAPGSRMNPGYQYVLNSMGGGMGGGTSNMMMGGGAGGKFYKGGQFLPGGGRAPAGGTFLPPSTAGGGFRGFMGSGLGLGLAGMGVGLATSAITSNMDTGDGKTAVSTVGGAASGALTGAALGSVIPGLGTAVGAVVGGLIGGVSSLVSEMQATREKEEADKAARDETQKKTNELIEQLSSRPVKLTINNEDLGRINTNTSMFSGNSKLATS